MSRWFKRAGKPQAPMIARTEEAHLQQVEDALLLLLNDDIDTAEEMLKSGESAYHFAGRGISAFIGSMLGAEEDSLQDAVAVLQIAENKAWEDLKRAQNESTAFRSNIYPAGTEYLLCGIVSQLTGAICAVMSGSVVQAISGFTKLRKAFVTLDSIIETEKAYSSRTEYHRPVVPDPILSSNHKASKHKAAGEQSLKDDSIVTVHISDDSDANSLSITSPIDVFIHSGVRLCYGILLIVFSMIENPVFAKVLYIVGFKGDRERGIRYLWQACNSQNFNGAIAGVSILMYYSGLVGYCDILPTDSGADDNISGFPRDRSKRLLAEMCERYPSSKLWRLEEARMQGFERDLAGAIRILAENSNSNMKQIAIINTFELSMNTMFHHDYNLMAKSWRQCDSLSKWSPTLYAFLAGVAYLELYRENRKDDYASAEKLKSKATIYLRKGPPLAGRQKLMSKQLPFDAYIVRKCQKWEERAKNWGIDLVDAIGISPLGEMIYLWGGTKKQNLDELEQSMKIIAWERSSSAEKHRNNLDEIAIHSLLQASILRNLGKYNEAREVLQKNILCYEMQDFRGHLKDDWTYPNALYEMACIAWQEKDLKGQDHNAKTLECSNWIEKIQKLSDPFVLDTRLSMKVMTSVATLKRHKLILGIQS
ncbi:unnamed protein product [Blumeria hordei]|uniref:Inclusion body clearance protein IML2 n=2 Tax=Blumeria hordei TaxID=2867405 RepID=A0A383UHH4_BLUHO|nr:Mitochondrial outer membrane protein iml2 [Blumeria hordei DH14]SZE99749.1 unnamed protein product [Blumeria hordei]